MQPTEESSRPEPTEFRFDAPAYSSGIETIERVGAERPVQEGEVLK